MSPAELRGISSCFGNLYNLCSTEDLMVENIFLNEFAPLIPKCQIITNLKYCF